MLVFQLAHSWHYNLQISRKKPHEVMLRCTILLKSLLGTNNKLPLFIRGKKPVKEIGGTQRFTLNVQALKFFR